MTSIGFTRDAQRSLEHAQREAQATRHGWVHEAHLLLGLLSGGGAEITKVLERFAPPPALRASVLNYLGDGGVSVHGAVPFSPTVQSIIADAQRDADRFGAAAVEPTHLLVALSSAPGTFPGRLLTDYGASTGRLRAELGHARSTQTPETVSDVQSASLATGCAGADSDQEAPLGGAALADPVQPMKETRPHQEARATQLRGATYRGAVTRIRADALLVPAPPLVSHQDGVPPDANAGSRPGPLDDMLNGIRQASRAPDRDEVKGLLWSMCLHGPELGAAVEATVGLDDSYAPGRNPRRRFQLRLTIAHTPGNVRAVWAISSVVRLASPSRLVAESALWRSPRLEAVLDILALSELEVFGQMANARSPGEIWGGHNILSGGRVSIFDIGALALGVSAALHGAPWWLPVLALLSGLWWRPTLSGLFLWVATLLVAIPSSYPLAVVVFLGALYRLGSLASAAADLRRRTEISLNQREYWRCAQRAAGRGLRALRWRQQLLVRVRLRKLRLASGVVEAVPTIEFRSSVRLGSGASRGNAKAVAR